MTPCYVKNSRICEYGLSYRNSVSHSSVSLTPIADAGTIRCHVDVTIPLLAIQVTVLYFLIFPISRCFTTGHNKQIMTSLNLHSYIH